MCAAPAAAAALAVLFPIIFNHPFPFFHLTIVFLVIDIVTSARIASVCIEDVIVRINMYCVLMSSFDVINELYCIHTNDTHIQHPNFITMSAYTLTQPPFHFL